MALGAKGLVSPGGPLVFMASGVPWGEPVSSPSPFACVGRGNACAAGGACVR